MLRISMSVASAALGLLLIREPSIAGGPQRASSLRLRTSCLHQIEAVDIVEEKPIQVLRGDGTVVTGVIQSLSDDGLVLNGAREESVTVAASEISGVTYWAWEHRESFITKEEAIGGAFGFIAGFAIGSILDTDDFVEGDRFEVSVGLVGALVGSLIGSIQSRGVRPQRREVHCAP